MLERKAQRAEGKLDEQKQRADAAEAKSRTAEASTDQLRADLAASKGDAVENCMARDAAVAACSAAVALASQTQWRVEQLERGQEALQAAASRSREVAAAASRSAAAVGRDVERLTGELLNQIVPGLRQARSALADASIAASDTPPGGSQTLDADAMQDALPPPPSLPSVDDEDARELDYAANNDETQLGEPAPADCMSRNFAAVFTASPRPLPTASGAPGEVGRRRARGTSAAKAKHTASGLPAPSRIAVLPRPVPA